MLHIEEQKKEDLSKYYLEVKSKILMSGWQYNKFHFLITLKTKEIREGKDKKKSKDRWVDIFMELKSNREKLSLKQIDNINKQQR